MSVTPNSCYTANSASPYAVLVEEDVAKARRWRRQPVPLHYWLVEKDTGETVAYAYVFHYEPEVVNTNERNILMAIEVREDYRGKGLAKEIAQAVKDVSGYPLYSLGMYTPDGFDRLRGLLPLSKDAENLRVAFRGQRFVTDWTDRIARGYP